MVIVLMFGIIVMLQAGAARLAWHRKTDKLTDLAYGGTFLVVSRWLYLTVSEQSIVHMILVLLLSIWSIRLGGYLFLRILALGKDRRFDLIRTTKRSFVKFRVLQAVVIGLLLLPVGRAFRAEAFSWTRYTVVGAAVSLLGIIIETIADRQKFRFKRQYPTLRCEEGLWKRSRHPNYFGEMLMRRGVYLFCLSSLSTWQAAVGLISPFTITWLLLFVTGIPLLEQEQEQKRGTRPERKKYKQTTNLLVPFF